MIRPILREVFLACSLFYPVHRTVTDVVKPIFIVGSQRSGTRLLEKLIDASSEVASWSEANYLWEPSYYKGLYKRPRYDLPGFIGKGIHAHSVDLDNRDTQTRIKRAFGLFCFLKGRRLLHRNPFNTVRLECLYNWFPDARIVHILRDVRAVVNSELSREWKRKSNIARREEFVDRVIYRWNECVRITREFKRKYPDHISEIKYANLSTSRQSKIMEQVYKFCSLSTAKRPWRKGPKIENRNIKWKQHMKASLIDRIESKVQDPSPPPMGFPECSLDD